MKLSLPLRIFLFHLTLMAGLGWLAVHLIREKFDEYEQAWKDTLETVPATDLFNPMASEVARSLLLELETDYPELQASLRREVGEALDSILPTLGAIESLIILDREGRPQYLNPPEAFELRVPFDDELAQFLESERLAEREVFGADGEKMTETVLPVIDVPVEYLSWFAEREFPGGELGWAMRIVHQAKLDGSDAIFGELRRRNGGWTKL